MNHSHPHTKKFETLSQELKTNLEKGLSSIEAKKRLETYGTNTIERESAISPLKVFISQFKDVIILILLAASILSFAIGDVVEGIAVIVVIFITTIFGFITEYKAEKSVEALQNMITPSAKVMRDGELVEIDAANIVPGDIIVIEEGDRVTADGRIFDADNLNADESILTGESEPVKKNKALINDEDIALAERKNMLHMGTTITRGNGAFIVTGTGENTQMGHISHLLQETVDETTPLEKQLASTGKFLIGVTFAITFIVAIVGILSGRDTIEMLKTATALAVAAVPEGLPAVATITLAIGMRKMVKKNAFLKSLPAVETLGSTTVVATDKTGTLTENQMTLSLIEIGKRLIHISGTGYKPEGKFQENNQVLDPLKDKSLKEFLEVSYLASNAVLSHKEEEGWTLIGDPTEGALVSATLKARLKESLDEHTKRIHEIPFDSDRLYMAVLIDMQKEEDNLIALKGAPKVMLDMCEYKMENGERVALNNEERKRLLKENDKHAKEGLRMLALASKRVSKDIDSLESELKDNLIFLGFAGVHDPPREDIKSSIADARSAGIRTLMITGDQRETAQAIAKEVGIIDNDQKVIMGSDLKTYSEEELRDVLKSHNVYSRVTPEDKLLIVKALNDSNEITAMTGDGVNDAPALKRASIGVSMGNRGTAVAKEASDMILLDDNFKTIIQAVKQGRVIFDNIQKFIHYLLSCNLSEILLIFAAIVLGFPVPLVAIQILWLNVVTGVFPAFSLAFETPEERTMVDPPREPGMPIITNNYKYRIVVQAVILSLGPLFAYLYFVNSEAYSLEVARTVGFMSLALVHMLHVFNTRKQNGLGLEKTMFKNPYLWGALLITIALQLFAIYVPFMQNVLKVVALDMTLWGYVALFGSAPIVFLQLVAFIRMKIGKPYQE